MEKVLIADFSSGKDRVTVRGLWQFDRGVKLKVIGINAADVNRVDFAPVIASEAVPVVVVPDEDGTFTVSIPGAATKSPYDVTAYIYVDTAEYGYTVKAVNMPVILRPEAGNPGEEKPDPFGEVVEKVSEYATEARDSARAAAESEKAASESATQAEKAKEASRGSAEKASESKEAAATSATAAAESASQARESATVARSAADQAGKSATSAAESATAATQQAENATQSATNAARSAESATQSAETAKTAADTAGKSASSAQQAARSAAESASTATAAAQTATTAAGEASESATTAAQSAETAGQKATAAETSAGNAAESATAAEKSATAAGDSASAAKASETAAGEAAQTAQEQAEKIKDSAEQIEKNKVGVDSLKEEKADKTTLAVTERKLDALWKLNQGISYQFEEDSEAAYQKEVPSGAKLASVKQIGGKTIVWNQLLNCDALKADLSRMYDVTNDDGIYTLIAKGIGNRAQQTIQVKQNHIYLMKAVTNEVDGNSVEFCPHSYGNAMANMAQCYNKGEGWKRIYQIIKAGYTGGLLFQFYLHASEYPATMQYKAGSFQVFDLTKMFGSGNEPATVEEFEAMFPGEGYSYNAGELLSACVSEVVEQGKNLFDQHIYAVSEAIRNLPGYGWSAGNVRNEVDWENKKYIQRVDQVDLGALNWVKSGDTQRDGYSTYKSDSLNTVIRRYNTYSGNSICEKFNIVKTKDINRNEYEYSISDSRTSYPIQFTVKSTFCTDKNDFKNKVNGIMLYYELAEPIITDISDIIGGTFQEPLEVEAGGTLTFKNSNGDGFQIPVPSEEEYIVSLAEVGGVTE